MRLDELKQYTRLKGDEIFYEVEIQRLKNLKNEKVSYYSASALSSVPSGGNVTSPTERLAILSVEYAEKIDEQIKDMKQKLQETREKLKEIDSFIESIDEYETRTMMRRHIKQRASFNQIANEHFVSRNYVAKRIKGVCD